MIARLEIDRSEVRDTLNGLQQTASVENDSFEDFNLVSLNNPNKLKLYVRHFDLFQVVHTLSDSDPISIEVDRDEEMVFSPDVLTSLIKKSKSDRINIRFSEDKFSVEARDSWFSTPTTFTLNLFNESQFLPITNVSGFEPISSINREELVENLEMMSIVSNIVHLKLTGNEFWISVSDAVHGNGKVMEKIDPSGIDIESFDRKYRIDIIQAFLNSVGTDFVEILINQDGTLRIRAEKEGHDAELTLAPRLAD